MSSKIDGVPRELLERLQSQTELSNDWDEVQALLAAPVVERQETVPKHKFDTLVQHCKRLDAEIAQARAHVNEVTLYQQNAVWFWQHDGEDYLQSLSCPIIIQPHHLRELLEGKAQHNPIASQPAPVAVLHFVCDRIPDQNGCTFIECENSEGSSINAGEWVMRPDGLAQLVVLRPPLKLPEYKRPPPGCVITQEMAAHNACLDKVKELNQ